MATPTLYPITANTVSPKTAFQSVTTSATAIVTAGADEACDIKTLILSNTTGTARTVTVDIYRSSVQKIVFQTVNVPANESAVPIGRDNPIYLEAGDALRLTASANSAIEATVSYELIAS